MIQFWIGRVQVRFDFSFFAVFSLLCLVDAGQYLTISLAVCMLHELGHLLAMRICRQGMRQVTFYGAGISICSDCRLSAFWQDLFILLAGPGINLLTGALLYVLTGPSVGALLNIGMGLFNLLPYRQLDGGSILHTLLFWKSGSPLQADRMLRSICIGCSGIGIAVGLLAGFSNFTFYGTVLYLTAAELFS